MPLEQLPARRTVAFSGAAYQQLIGRLDSGRRGLEHTFTYLE